MNYLGPPISQGIPLFCGCCWAFGSISALSDRINYLITKNQPKVLLPTQYGLNCVEGSGCHGGDHPTLYKTVHEKGIPEAGCATFLAVTPAVQSCSKIQQCKTCSWGQGGQVSTCIDTPHKSWWVSEFGQVQGIDNIKREVYQRGPISCSMYASDKFFYGYKGGIYSEKLKKPKSTNHVVSIVGFGKDIGTGTEYWIVRNSWGSFWGEEGFFRIKIGEDNLLIETRCWYGVPSEDKSVVDK